MKEPDRRKMRISAFSFLVLYFFISPFLSGGEIKGYMFGDYYSVLSHHDRDIEGRHGFWFRRIYFTYDNRMSESLKMRLRFEMNSPGDFVSSSSLVPYVKDAYLSYKPGRHELAFGLQPTPTWDNIEDFWGYRALEKTPLDLFKMGSSRDFGLSLGGTLTSDETFSYKLLFGNGSSTQGETDKGKKIYGQVGFKPAGGFYLELYGDYEAQKDDKTYVLIQGFAGYENSWGRAGLVLAQRHFSQEVKGAKTEEYSYNIFSAFAVVYASPVVDLVFRFDRNFGDGFEKDFAGRKVTYIPLADNSLSNLFIAGLSWRAASNVWLIPNVKCVFYDEPESGDRPSKDLYANMTVWFKF